MRIQYFSLAQAGDKTYDPEYQDWVAHPAKPKFGEPIL